MSSPDAAPYISLFYLPVNGYFVIRVCGSTLYVGLACAVPPTNTNFRLTFYLTRLQEALMKTYLYRASNSKSTITFLAFVS